MGGLPVSSVWARGALDSQRPQSCQGGWGVRVPAVMTGTQGVARAGRGSVGVLVGLGACWWACLLIRARPRPHLTTPDHTQPGVSWGFHGLETPHHYRQW